MLFLVHPRTPALGPCQPPPFEPLDGADTESPPADPAQQRVRDGRGTGTPRYGLTGLSRSVVRALLRLFLDEWREHGHVRENYPATDGENLTALKKRSDGLMAWGGLLAYLAFGEPADARPDGWRFAHPGEPADLCDLPPAGDLGRTGRTTALHGRPPRKRGRRRHGREAERRHGDGRYGRYGRHGQCRGHTGGDRHMSAETAASTDILVIGEAAGPLAAYCLDNRLEAEQVYEDGERLSHFQDELTRAGVELARPEVKGY